MQDGRRPLMVKILHALDHVVREDGVLRLPSSTALRSDNVDQRAVLDKLEHDAELVGALVPYSAMQLDEVWVVQGRHHLRAAQGGISPLFD